MSLANLIFSKTKDYNDLTAVNCQGQTITYHDLNARSLILASLIRDYGFSNDTVAIIGKKKISSYIAILGVLYGGCNYTPLNDSYNIEKKNWDKEILL